MNGVVLRIFFKTSDGNLLKWTFVLNSHYDPLIINYGTLELGTLTFDTEPLIWALNMNLVICKPWHEPLLSEPSNLNLLIWTFWYDLWYGFLIWSDYDDLWSVSFMTYCWPILLTYSVWPILVWHPSQIYFTRHGGSMSVSEMHLWHDSRAVEWCSATSPFLLYDMRTLWYDLLWPIWFLWGRMDAS